MSAQRKSLGDLLAETPRLITDLLRAEVDNLKAEVSGKAKGLGMGGALLAGAAVGALFLLGWLLVAGFEALKLLVAPWLAALIVALVLLVVTAILALAGRASIQRNKDFGNLQAVDSIKDDVNMVRGLGHAADGTDPLSDLPTTTMSGAAR